MTKRYIAKMEDLNLIKKGGFMLDLGCGMGADSDYFKSKGYSVTSVDFEGNYVTKKIDICDFKIEKDTYDVIIASNVLPFIADKTEVQRILTDMGDGLKKDGVMYFSVFGVNDEWATKDTMSFYTHDEIETVVKILSLKLIEKTSIEGLGKTMKGDIKYWQVYTFTLQK